MSFIGDSDLLRPLLANDKQKPSKLDELLARLADAEKQANKLAKLIVDDPEPSALICNRLKLEEAKAKHLQAQVAQEQIRERAERPALLAYDEFNACLPVLAKDSARRPELRRAIAGLVENITLDLWVAKTPL